jgi:uroporphyrinogen decarboxylase
LDIGSGSKEYRYLLDRINEYFIAWNKNYLASVDGKVDIVAIGDDYGMQDRTILSPEMWRKCIKPRYAELIDSIKSNYPNVKLFHHSCGSIYPIIDDLIEIGVDILNSIQPTAKDMEPEKLKKKYGDRITFHGGIDVQNLLPFGTPREIQSEVRRRLEILAENGGYIVAPSHNIQAGTPAENIIAFYEMVNEYASSYINYR